MSGMIRSLRIGAQLARAHFARMIDLPGAGLEGVIKGKKQIPRRRKYAARRKRVLSKQYYDGPSSWLIPMEETYARLLASPGGSRYEDGTPTLSFKGA
jgi:hypothetical protein